MITIYIKDTGDVAITGDDILVRWFNIPDVICFLDTDNDHALFALIITVPSADPLYNKLYNNLKLYRRYVATNVVHLVEDIIKKCVLDIIKKNKHGN